MPFPWERSPARDVYAGLDLPRMVPRRGRLRLWLPVCLLLLAGAIWLLSYFRALSIGNALPEARDLVSLRLSETVAQVMSRQELGYDWFVTLQTDENGNVTAVTTNTARVNLLAAEVMEELVLAAENGKFDLRISLGDLLGAGVLLGKGPEIPVQISMRSSSFLRFENEFSATGINQTRHALKLVAAVDIDLLVPWGSESTTVTTDILVAETVIVGRVPGTYVTGK